MLDNILDNMPVTAGSMVDLELNLPDGYDAFVGDYLQLGDKAENKERCKKIFCFVSGIMREAIGIGITKDTYKYNVDQWASAGSYSGVRLPSKPIETLNGIKIKPKGSDILVSTLSSFIDVWNKQGILLVKPNAAIPSIDKNKPNNIQVSVTTGYSNVKYIPSVLLYIGLNLVRELYTDNSRQGNERGYYRTQNIANRVRRMAENYIKYRI